MGILIENALVILPEGAEDVIRETSLYIEEDRITGIGDKPAGFTADKVIDGKDKLVIPGLINCHTHSYMSFMRNVADDLSFMDWLFGTIDPIEQQMTDEDTYWGANLAIIEMMKSGTTCFNDMQMNIHQTTRAVKESGMRAVICRGLVGSGNDEAGQSRLRQAYEERDAAKDCDRLTFKLGPHAPYTCDDEFLKIVAAEAKKENMGIHRDGLAARLSTKTQSTESRLKSTSLSKNLHRKSRSSLILDFLSNLVWMLTVASCLLRSTSARLRNFLMRLIM